MIIVRIGFFGATRPYELRWQAGKWVDKAGHVWKLIGENFTSLHGSSDDWKVA